MNHDATHCLDYKEACSKVCYRARLTADLQQRGDLQGLPMSWAHFKGTDECLIWPKKKECVI